jgi:hypothetical protein
MQDASNHNPIFQFCRCAFLWIFSHPLRLVLEIDPKLVLLHSNASADILFLVGIDQKVSNLR